MLSSIFEPGPLLYIGNGFSDGHSFRSMDLDRLLRDEEMQLSVLSDAAREFSALEDMRTVLIAPNVGQPEANPDISMPLTRPITVPALMAHVHMSQTPSSAVSNSRAELHRLLEKGVPWWQRTWIILTLIFVSPSLQQALRSGPVHQEAWLQGYDNTPSFNERFDSYICGNKNGVAAITPLEATIEEIALWDLLSR